MYQVMLLSMVFVSSPNEEKAVEQAVERFASGGDRQDAEALEKVLHEQFRVVLAQPSKDEATVMSRDQYLELIRAKKIGGVRRNVKVKWLEVRGDLAFAKAELSSEKASFDGLYTLAREGGRWRIIQDAVMFTPR